MIEGQAWEYLIFERKMNSSLKETIRVFLRFCDRSESADLEV